MEDDRPSTVLEKLSMAFIGMTNNLFFFIVMSSAQRIIKHYNANGFLPATDTAITVSGLFAGSINTAFSQWSISYDLRFIMNACLMGIGVLGCAYAPKFWMCLVSIVFLGSSCNFGESVTLGYMAYIKKSSMMKFWGIGTGIAGISGALYTIVVISFDFNYVYSFLCLLPLLVLYLLCYFLVLREKPLGIDPRPLISENPNEEPEKQENVKCWSASFLKKILYYVITCDLTYFAQDVIASAFLDCAQTQEFQKNHKYFYPLLTLVEHIGVLIFCSSLSFFEFPHLRFITLFQIGNFFIWMLQAMYHWMPIWSEFVLIFIVGSVAGLGYANTYHMILKDKNLSPKEKEIGTNVTALTATIAVLIDTGFGILAEKTFLKPFVPA